MPRVGYRHNVRAGIVTATLVLVGGNVPRRDFRFLIDPGVEIPEESTAFHGISTEQARAEGRASADALGELARLCTRPGNVAYRLWRSTAPTTSPCWTESLAGT